MQRSEAAEFKTEVKPVKERRGHKMVVLVFVISSREKRSFSRVQGVTEGGVEPPSVDAGEEDILFTFREPVDLVDKDPREVGCEVPDGDFSFSGELVEVRSADHFSACLFRVTFNLERLVQVVRESGEGCEDGFGTSGFAEPRFAEEQRVRSEGIAEAEEAHGGVGDAVVVAGVDEVAFGDGVNIGFELFEEGVFSGFCWFRGGAHRERQ